MGRSFARAVVSLCSLVGATCLPPQRDPCGAVGTWTVSCPSWTSTCGTCAGGAAQTLTLIITQANLNDGSWVDATIQAQFDEPTCTLTRIADASRCNSVTTYDFNARTANVGTVCPQDNCCSGPALTCTMTR